MLLLNTFGDLSVVLTSNCISFSAIPHQQGKKKLKSLKKVSLELSFHDLCLSYNRREKVCSSLQYKLQHWINLIKTGSAALTKISIAYWILKI